MRVAPIGFRAACSYVERVHRHHRPPRGHKFSIALIKGEDEVVGVIMAGRPVNRVLDDGLTIEINRLATDGTFNACSMLYGAAVRASKALGYWRVVTYTLPSEGGASLRASGWRLDGVTAGGQWVEWKSLKRSNDWPVDSKCRWVRTFQAERPVLTLPPNNQPPREDPQVFLKLVAE